MTPPLQMKSAWLITWEWIGRSRQGKKAVAAILGPRLNPETARFLVEQLYINSQFSLAERLCLARNPRNNPYPAEFDRIGGIGWQGRIICGHNPFLVARLVRNLRLVSVARGRDRLMWDERPKPYIAGVGEQIDT